MGWNCPQYMQDKGGADFFVFKPGFLAQIQVLLSQPHRFFRDETETQRPLEFVRWIQMAGHSPLLLIRCGDPYQIQHTNVQNRLISGYLKV